MTANFDSMTQDEARSLLLSLSRQYAEKFMAQDKFSLNSPLVPVSGKVVGADELSSLVDASLDLWLTTGRFNTKFEQKMRPVVGRKTLLTCNSGSSANLLALTALTSPLLGKDALKPGDEVITCATGFPTTVNPIISNGLVPVFVDVSLPTYNIDVSRLEDALSAKTKAVMVAHTLGNPFDLSAVVAFCEKHGLFLIEDTCDALGSLYDEKKVGTFGDLATLSFYPAHHITMGEGGAVYFDKPIYKRIVESLRDWGRDCWCEPGNDNTCKKRFEWQLGELPCGYDHKYTYSHLGYNLKITDMQAAVGLAQIAKIGDFVERRISNFQYLKEGLSQFSKHLVLPRATHGSKPSWFGFPISVKETDKFTRDDLVKYLNANGIGTRLLFGGNLVRQPYFIGRDFRKIGDLSNADFVMRNTFWIGVYPGLSEQALSYVVSVFENFFAGEVAK